MCLAMNWLHCIRYSIKEEIVSNCDASTIKEVRFVDFSAMIECIFPNAWFGKKLHRKITEEAKYGHDNSDTIFR